MCVDICTSECKRVIGNETKSSFRTETEPSFDCPASPPKDGASYKSVRLKLCQLDSQPAANGEVEALEGFKGDRCVVGVEHAVELRTAGLEFGSELLLKRYYLVPWLRLSGSQTAAGALWRSLHRRSLLFLRSRQNRFRYTYSLTLRAMG